MKVVKKVIQSLLIIAALVFTLSDFPSVSLASSNEPERVSWADAQKAAAWQVITEVKTESDRSHWKDKRIKVAKPKEVYDPAGNLVAYLVDVVADNQPAGYVMVSAFLDDDPVLLWTDDGKSLNPEDEKMKGKLGANKDKVAKSEIVWLGGDMLVARYHLKDGTKRMVDLNGEDRLDTGNDAYPAPASQNVHARYRWGIMKKIGLGSPGESNPENGVTDVDPATWETNYQSISKGYIDTPVNQKQWEYAWVNGVAQWTGCSPTAGSNIMKYWADKGVAKRLNPTDNQQDIVMALRNTMGTYQKADGTGETNPYNISSGLEQYARNQGYSNAYSTSIYLANFADYVGEVNEGRPSLQSYWNQTYFKNHTVTVVGYKRFVRDWYQADSYYLVVRNNWKYEYTNNLYVKWGTWNTNMITKFWFVF
ncbi:C39 family peptidase [Effusibacillus pohliae]|uniref:C39 family peptidase n=1 Tax=Effusibacillus pohliae TaxID=232270 RepID=UPI0003722F58|nr:C39 family peptidase [Effusibacillus pohliae]